MNLMPTRRARYRALLSVALAGILSGCAALPFSGNSHRAATVRERTRSAAQGSDARPRDLREQAMLAAVEKFLTQTEDFQTAESRPAASDARTGPSAKRPPQSVGGVASQRADANEDLPLDVHDGAVANSQVVLTQDAPQQPQQSLPVIRSVSIRPVAGQGDDTAPPVEEPTTNQPLAVRPPTEEMTEARFVDYLESRTTADDAFDFDAEWRLRLVHAALGQFSKAAEVSPKMSADARDMLDSLVRVAAATRRVAGDPLAEGDDALEQVDELRQIVADRADPIVKSIEWCRKVVTFGVFEEMDASEFVAGQATRTIIYTEIANLSAEQTSDGQYRTSLSTRAEVLTADGTSVWQHEEPDIVDVCRRRRTDFFIAERITLPPTLSAGDYVFKLLVEDKLSGKANEASRPFTIQSPISVAASG